MQWARGSAHPAPLAMPVPAARSTTGNLCSGLCSAPSLGSCSDFPSHCPGAAPRWLRGVGWTLGGARVRHCRALRGGSRAEGHPWVPGQGSHPACWGSPRAERSQKLALCCHKHPAKSNTSLEHRPSKSHLRTRLPSSGARAGSPPPRGAPLTLSPLGDPSLSQHSLVPAPEQRGARRAGGGGRANQACKPQPLPAGAASCAAPRAVDALPPATLAGMLPAPRVGTGRGEREAEPGARVDRMRWRQRSCRLGSARLPQQPATAPAQPAAPARRCAALRARLDPGQLLPSSGEQTQSIHSAAVA